MTLGRAFSQLLVHKEGNNSLVNLANKVHKLDDPFAISRQAVGKMVVSAFSDAAFCTSDIA